MPAAAPLARMIFTVDVDAGFPASDLPGLRQIEIAAGRLIDVFRRRQLQATWGLSQLAGSSLARRLVDAGHEIAVLGEPAWLGVGIDRKRSATELAQRCAALAGAGAQTKSLLVHQVPANLPLDVLARHGIRGVRRPPAVAERSKLKRLIAHLSSAPKESPVRALRHGIRELAGAVSVPSSSGRRVLRSLVAKSGSVAPLVIDLSRMAAGPEAGWQAIERLVEQAGQLRDAGQLHVPTMADWLLGVERAARTAARSILHRAA